MLWVISRGVAVVERLAEVVVAGLVVIGLAIVFGQFVDRHFVDLPWDAPDQFARIALVWLCFNGTALALAGGSAIRVDLLDHVLPRRVLVVRDVVFDLILLALLALIAVKSRTVVEIGAMQILLGTPFTADVAYSGLLSGAVLGCLVVIARLIRRTTGEPEAREH